MDAITRLAKEIKKLWRAVRKLQITGFQRPTWLAAPLTSVAWDGDAYSTTAKTLIDMSAVFGAPANIKSIVVYTAIRDSGSAGGDYFLILSPNNVAGQGIPTDVSFEANDTWNRACLTVPCDANGDVYYQIQASGASTMDVVIQVWGYWL